MKRRSLLGIMAICACLALVVFAFQKHANASKATFSNFSVAVKPGYSAPPGQFVVKVKDITTGAVVYQSPVFGRFGDSLPFSTTIPEGEYAVEISAMYIIKASSNGDERTVTGSETWIASGGATPINILVRPN